MTLESISRNSKESRTISKINSKKARLSSMIGSNKKIKELAIYWTVSGKGAKLMPVNSNHSTKVST
jgi:hypothetical protein